MPRDTSLIPDVSSRLQRKETKNIGDLIKQDESLKDKSIGLLK